MDNFFFFLNIFLAFLDVLLRAHTSKCIGFNGISLDWPVVPIAYISSAAEVAALFFQTLFPPLNSLFHTI